MRNRTEIRAERNLGWGDGVLIHILNFIPGVSGGSVAVNVEFEALQEGTYHEPLLRLDFASAQQLMNDLWSCNIRPTATIESEGHLAAVKYHLEDMRKLAGVKE